MTSLPLPPQLSQLFPAKFEFCNGGRPASLILRRSRSLAVTHSLPSPSDGLHSRSCSWRHDALVLSAPIATLLRIGQKWHLRARYSKLYFLKFLISENMLHLIWLAERRRASWRHEHDLEWSPSDGEGRECVTVSDLDRLRIRLAAGRPKPEIIAQLITLLVDIKTWSLAW